VQQTPGFNISVLNNDQNIYFDKISDLHYIRDEWNLVIYYNMSTYWQAMQNIQKYVIHIQENSSNNKYNNTSYESLMLQLDKELDEIDHYNKLLMSQYSRRQKRGLIDGVGYIANSLFGVLDERFAEQYQKDIEHIKQNEQHLQKLLHNQTIIMEAEYNILKRHEEVMQKQFSFIEKHLDSLNLEINHVRVDISNTMYLTSSCLAAHIIISNIRRIQNVLISTVTDINQGHINMHLISPEQLSKQINIISSRLQRDLVLPTDVSNIMQLYKLLKVSSRMTDKYLIIKIEIPIISSDVFELDRIITVPQKRKLQYYHIMPTFLYIGFNINKDAIIFLSEFDLQKCRHASPEKMLCLLDNPIYSTSIKQSICDIKLISSATDLSPCKTVITSCKENWIKLHADNSWLFTCCAECDVRIMCPSGITSQVLKNNGIIHLGPMCTLKGNHFVIHSHNNFFNALNVKQTVEIPEFSVLNKIINTATVNITDPETEEKVWQSLKSEISELKEQSSSELNIHDVHHYSLGYGIVGLLIIIGGAIVCWRLRRKGLTSGAGASRPGSPHPKETADNTATAADNISEVSVQVPGIKSVPNALRQSVLSVDKTTSPMVNRSIKFEIPVDE
jgi:hypothetical protein